jgi:hypothetical protein
VISSAASLNGQQPVRSDRGNSSGQRPCSLSEKETTMLKNQALSGRSNRHLSAFADDLEDQRFLDSIFLNKAVAKDVLIEHLKSRQPGRLPESEAKNLLSLIGVFDQEVDFELILLFVSGFPKIPNKLLYI